MFSPGHFCSPFHALWLPLQGFAHFLASLDGVLAVKPQPQCAAILVHMAATANPFPIREVPFVFLADICQVQRFLQTATLAAFGFRKVIFDEIVQRSESYFVAAPLPVVGQNVFGW